MPKNKIKEYKVKKDLPKLSKLSKPLRTPGLKTLDRLIQSEERKDTLKREGQKRALRRLGTTREKVIGAEKDGFFRANQPWWGDFLELLYKPYDMVFSALFEQSKGLQRIFTGKSKDIIYDIFASGIHGGVKGLTGENRDLNLAAIFMPSIKTAKEYREWKLKQDTATQLALLAGDIAFLVATGVGARFPDQLIMGKIFGAVGKGVKAGWNKWVVDKAVRTELAFNAAKQATTSYMDDTINLMQKFGLETEKNKNSFLRYAEAKNWLKISKKEMIIAPAGSKEVTKVQGMIKKWLLAKETSVSSIYNFDMKMLVQKSKLPKEVWTNARLKSINWGLSKPLDQGSRMAYDATLSFYTMKNAFGSVWQSLRSKFDWGAGGKIDTHLAQNKFIQSFEMKNKIVNKILPVLVDRGNGIINRMSETVHFLLQRKEGVSSVLSALRGKNPKLLERLIRVGKNKILKTTSKIVDTATTVGDRLLNKNDIKQLLQIFKKNTRWSIKTEFDDIVASTNKFVNSEINYSRAVKTYSLHEARTNFIKNNQLILPYTEDNYAFLEMLRINFAKLFYGTNVNINIVKDPLNFVKKGLVDGSTIKNKLLAFEGMLTSSKPKDKKIIALILSEEPIKTAKLVGKKVLTKVEQQQLIRSTIDMNTDELLEMSMFNRQIKPISNIEDFKEGVEKILRLDPKRLARKESHLVYQKILTLFTNNDIPVNKYVIKSLLKDTMNIMGNDEKVIKLIKLFLTNRGGLTNLRNAGDVKNFFTSVLKIKHIKPGVSFSKRTLKKIDDLAITWSKRIKILAEQFESANQKTYLGRLSAVMQKRLAMMYDIKQPTKLGALQWTHPEVTQYTDNIIAVEKLILETTGLNVNLGKGYEATGVYPKLFETNEAHQFWVQFKRALEAERAPMSYDLYSKQLWTGKQGWTENAITNPTFNNIRNNRFDETLRFLTPGQANSAFGKIIFSETPLAVDFHTLGVNLKDMQIQELVKAVFDPVQTKALKGLTYTREFIKKKKMPISLGGKAGATGVNHVTGVSDILPDGTHIIDLWHPNVITMTNKLRDFSLLSGSQTTIEHKVMNNLLTKVTQPIRDGNQIISRFSAGDLRSIKMYKFLKDIGKVPYNTGTLEKYLQNFVDDIYLTHPEYIGSKLQYLKNRISTFGYKDPQLDEVARIESEIKSRIAFARKEKLPLDVAKNIIPEEQFELLENKMINLGIHLEEKGAGLSELLAKVKQESWELKNAFQIDMDARGAISTWHSKKLINNIIRNKKVYIENNEVTRDVVEMMSSMTTRVETMDDISKYFITLKEEGYQYVKMDAGVMNLLKRVPIKSEWNAFDKILNHSLLTGEWLKFWKGFALINPTYHSRNHVSNMVQSFLAGVPVHRVVPQTYISMGVVAKANFAWRKSANKLQKIFSDGVNRDPKVLEKLITPSVDDVFGNSKILKGYLNAHKRGTFSGTHPIREDFAQQFDVIKDVATTEGARVSEMYKLQTGWKQSLNNKVTGVFDKNMQITKFLDQSQKLTTFNYISDTVKKKGIDIINGRLVPNKNVLGQYAMVSSVDDWVQHAESLTKKAIIKANAKKLLKGKIEKIAEDLRAINKNFKKEMKNVSMADIKSGKVGSKEIQRLNNEKIKKEMELHMVYTKYKNTKAVPLKNALAQAQEDFSYDFGARAAIHAHYNYSELSLFERRYIKKIFPFYTWTKKAIHYVLKTLMKKPTRVGWINRNYNEYVNAITKGDDEKLPDWFKKAGRIPIPQEWTGGKDKKSLRYVKSQMVFMAPANPFDGGPINVLNSINPALKLLTEEMFGYNFYKKEKILDPFAGLFKERGGKQVLNSLFFYDRYAQIIKDIGKVDQGEFPRSMIGEVDTAREKLKKETARDIKISKYFAQLRKRRIKYSTAL